jgi:tight adherence protein C
MRALFDIDLTYAVTLAVAFGAAVAFVLGIRYVAVSGRDVVRDRLRRTLGLVPLPTATAGAELTRRTRASWEVALEPIARVARPASERELGRLRSRLSHAGLRSERALVGYLGAKALFGIGFALGFLTVNSFWPQPPTYAALCTIASTALGFYAPSLWLVGRISERRRQIDHALPDALDLLVTCVEAGLGLEAAIQRVAGELDLGAPLLARELEQTELEMRAGVSRGVAFRRMADRTGVEELRNLSAIIIQTQIFGTSIAKSLRIQADAIRVRRMQLAEERAAAASVKMTVPLVLCIAPALFAVLIGPAVVKIVRILLPTLSGGH